MLEGDGEGPGRSLRVSSRPKGERELDRWFTGVPGGVGLPGGTPALETTGSSLALTLYSLAGGPVAF